MQCEALNCANQVFVVASIDKVIKRKYSYNNKATKIELKNTIITLPVKNGDVDFDFMEQFINELQSERIDKLDKYLLENRLSNYNLTDKEKQALEGFKDLEWGEHKLGDLFEVNSYKKRFDANKVKILEEGKHPYVVRMGSDNGQKGFINEDVAFLNEGNTISFGQDTATMFYQEKPYFTGDKIKIFKPKEKRFNKQNSQFFISTMTKSFSNFSWGGTSFKVEILKNQKVSLPVKNKKPDYETMETLISAIRKLLIKDVVLYVKKNKLAS